MDGVTAVLVFLVCFVLSAALVALVRRCALRAAWLDVPNERSSHTVPTPRGGGLGIAATVLGALALLAASGRIDAGAAIGAGGGAALLCAIGWLDDRRSLAVRWRALAQVVAALWILAWMGAPARIEAGPLSVEWAWLAALLAALAFVWLVNLYNFMDGTDGIAAVQGLSAALAGAWLLARGGEPAWALLALALAGACAGFLLWNRPPARIFMGDSGSYFVGFTFGALALAGERSGAVPALVWLVLLAVFAADATFTLLARLRAGAPAAAAHRDHAYQRCVQLGRSHGQVALAVLALNLGLCWPLAWYAWRRPQALPWVAAVTALIMFAMWWLVQKSSRRAAGGR